MEAATKFALLAAGGIGALLLLSKKAAGSQVNTTPVPIGPAPLFPSPYTLPGYLDTPYNPFPANPGAAPIDMGPINTTPWWQTMPTFSPSPSPAPGPSPAPPAAPATPPVNTTPWWQGGGLFTPTPSPTLPGTCDPTTDRSCYGPVNTAPAEPTPVPCYWDQAIPASDPNCHAPEVAAGTVACDPATDPSGCYGPVFQGFRGVVFNHNPYGAIDVAS